MVTAMSIIASVRLQMDLVQGYCIERTPHMREYSWMEFSTGSATSTIRMNRSTLGTFLMA